MGDEKNITEEQLRQWAWEMYVVSQKDAHRDAFGNRYPLPEFPAKPPTDFGKYAPYDVIVADILRGEKKGEMPMHDILVRLPYPHWDRIKKEIEQCLGLEVYEKDGKDWVGLAQVPT